MTRRTRTSRSLDSRLDTLETNTAESAPLVEVVWRDDRTGELLDSDGKPTEPDPDALMIIFNETVIVDRERAEAEGYDILAPAEDVPPGRDAVRVAEDSI
jgi:hypothetical protein